MQVSEGGKLADVLGHLDLQHGDQAHVAIGTRIGGGIRIHVVEGLAIHILNLPLIVVDRPVQHGLRVAQMLGIGGDDLKLNLGQLGGSQVVHG